jgi:hypothetical protein
MARYGKPTTPEKNWRLTIDGVEMTVVHCLTQDPSDPAVVHVGVADVGASVTTDGGRRLIAGHVPNEGADRDGGGNMKAIDLSPKLPNRLYAVGNKNHQAGWAANQVFVSIDRGQTWRRSPMAGLPDMATQRSTTIVADPNDPYTVYLTVSGTIRENWGGVYKSTDGGASWTWMGRGLPEGKYFFPAKFGRMVASSQLETMVLSSRWDKLTIWYIALTRNCRCGQTVVFVATTAGCGVSWPTVSSQDAFSSGQRAMACIAVTTAA